MSKPKLMADVEMDIIVVLQSVLYEELKPTFMEMQRLRAADQKRPQARTTSFKRFMEKGLNPASFAVASSLRGRCGADPFTWLDVNAAAHVIGDTLHGFTSPGDKRVIPELNSVLPPHQQFALAWRAAMIFTASITHPQGREEMRARGFLKNIQSNLEAAANYGKKDDDVEAQCHDRGAEEINVMDKATVKAGDDKKDGEEHNLARGQETMERSKKVARGTKGLRFLFFFP